MNPTTSEDCRAAAAHRAMVSIARYRRAYGDWPSDTSLAVTAIADLMELFSDKDLPQLAAAEFKRRESLEQQDLERRDFGAERKEWKAKRRWVPARTLIGWANLHCRGLQFITNGEDAAAMLKDVASIGLTGETRTVG